MLASSLASTWKTVGVTVVARVTEVGATVLAMENGSLDDTALAAARASGDAVCCYEVERRKAVRICALLMSAVAAGG